jgi:hypothetical protein
MTQVGKKYKLTFAYGPREQKRADGDNLLGVSFGNLKANLDAGTSKSGWKMFSGTITADSDTTRLKFVTQGKFDTYGANIDAVSVEAVPEPFRVLGLTAVGVVGAASAIRKRFAA